MSIDGESLIDAWQGHTVRTDSASIYLEAGKDYQLKAEYYDNRDYAIAKLQWKVPQVGKETLLDLYGEAGKAVRDRTATTYACPKTSVSSCKRYIR